MSRGPGPGGSNEASWIAAARAGDADAFEQLYRSTVSEVYGACRRLAAHDAEAEDATQRTYLRAWQKLDTYRGDGRIGAWLRRIAVRQLLDGRRARWAQELQASPETLIELPAAPARSSDTVVDLERAIRRLPPGARQVFVLHDLEGLTHGEIADALGVTAGTTKTQLHRARRALKEWLT